MSSRHFRKACAVSRLPPVEDERGEDYEPLYAQKSPGSSLYSALVLSSGSEPENRAPSEGEPEVTTTSKKKKPKKKRGKGKASKNPRANAQMDEIDRSLKEVNALLGEPVAGPSCQAPLPPTVPSDPMKVTRMHLNVNYELKRLFGATSTENTRRSRNETSYLMLRRVLILPINDTLVYNYKKKKGVSMFLDRCENDVMYFVYEHNPERQLLHKQYLALYRQRDNNNFMNVEEIRNNMHVEGLMELAEALFRLEEYSLANEIIENVIAYLQYCAHPSFNIANSNVRLEYKHWENRPFHVSVMKFMYLLTNKACHRTALELAKMLLNIDPSDPLAVLFIIDTLAIRAREYEWLVTAINNFDKMRDAGVLFNIKFSRALAVFHLATKKNESIAEANELLQEAVLAYPKVAMKLLKLAKVTNSPLETHELFTEEAGAPNQRELNVLIFIYTKMIHSRFREPPVFEWFRKNLTELADKYTNDEDVRLRAQELRRLRNSTFIAGPLEVMRHMGILKHMATLIFEEPLPLFQRQTCGWDPLQDAGINQYNYLPIINPPSNVGTPEGSAMYSFFSSMLPSYETNDPRAGE